MAKKVLIIDDDPNIVKMLESRLKANSYEVATALNGFEGLDKVREEKPDLIILDIVMPKMDGYTFIQELKTREVDADEPVKRTPIIVITAKEKMQDLFKMEGVKDYIVKPFAADELLEKVQKYI